MAQTMTEVADDRESTAAVRRLVVYCSAELLERLETLARREHRRVGPQAAYLIEKALESDAATETRV